MEIRGNRYKVNALSERARLALLGVLLCIMLGVLAFAAVNTFRAVENFQQQYHAAKSGDVSAIRPWMTMHVVSHICHVPEAYLDRSLQVSQSDAQHKATLYEIATHKKVPVDQVIRSVQRAVLQYRKEHSYVLTATPARRTGLRSRSPSSGGMPY